MTPPDTVAPPAVAKVPPVSSVPTAPVPPSASSAAHAIPVRRMQFPQPDAADFQPLYIGGNSALSYIHTALGLYAAYLEPFVVKSFRGVIDRIQDPMLRESVDRFCRQEAQHYQRHTDFNRIVLAQGYPGLQARLDRVKGDFERFLAERSDRFRVAFTVGFESYATASALHALRVGWYDNEFTLQPWGELFKWHMLEEIEHRQVAEDVYEHLFGGTAYRGAMCWVAHRHMVNFLMDCALLMSRADIPRHGPRCRITPKARVILALAPLGISLRTLKPGYSARQLEIPAHVGVLSRQYSRQAESVV
jgi:predicted metal-dependent hydrolase